MSKSCIICKSAESNVVFKEFEVDILKCLNCGHVYSSYEVNQFYDEYFDASEDTDESYFWWGEAHEKIYSDFCRKFITDKSGCLLDVGCGLGFFVKIVSDYPEWEAYGYEISKKAVEHAQNKLGLDKVRCGPVEESDFEDKTFDVITLWDVIEHVPNPDPMLSYLSTILKDDGILFMHTPNVTIQLIKAKMKRMIKGMRKSVHYLEAKDHVNIYSRKAITAVLNRNGFNRVKFIHLAPIQSISGSTSVVAKFVKNSFFTFSKYISFLSFGIINLDNLFVIARKSSSS